MTENDVMDIRLAFLSLWVLYNLWTVIIRLAFPELHRVEASDSWTWNLCDALGSVGSWFLSRF